MESMNSRFVFERLKIFTVERETPRKPQNSQTVGPFLVFAFNETRR